MRIKAQSRAPRPVRILYIMGNLFVTPYARAHLARLAAQTDISQFFSSGQNGKIDARAPRAYGKDTCIYYIYDINTPLRVVLLLPS